MLMIVGVALPVRASPQILAGPGILFRGVNLAGAGFDSETLPGRYGVNYIYPTHAEMDYFLAKRMNIFRLPFRWERLQPRLFESFNAAELDRMDNFVTQATRRGATVILSPQNSARYYGQLIGSPAAPTTALVDFWGRLAAHYQSNPQVIFSVMNEPHTMPTETVRDLANSAISAVRRRGATNLVLISGNGWSGAHSWNQTWYGTANGVAMLGITDPGQNYAFEVNQYLDDDASGATDTCVSQTIGSQRLTEFTNWLREHQQRGFLGKFAGGRNETCLAALDDMLTYLDGNSEVWLGWTYWAAGPWWGDYSFSLEPLGGQDRPQMIPLSRHLLNSANTDQ